MGLYLHRSPQRSRSSASWSYLDAPRAPALDTATLTGTFRAAHGSSYSQRRAQSWTPTSAKSP